MEIGARKPEGESGHRPPIGEQVPKGFWAAAREEPDRVALVDATGRRWTAGELLSGANRLVHALRARGVQPFDPVATLTRNSAELFQVLRSIGLGRRGRRGIGLFAGAATGIGWVAMSLGVIYLFEQRSLKLWLIDSGYQVVSYTLMGGILGAWH